MSEYQPASLETIQANTPLFAYALGAQDTRELIRAKILDRVNDLKTCHKKDNCFEFGSYIEDYIAEWLDDEQES